MIFAPGRLPTVPLARQLAAVLAFALVWAQLATVAHLHRDDAGRAPPAGSHCDLCLAQDRTGPAPALPSLPAPQATTGFLDLPTATPPPADTPARAHRPRGPPAAPAA